MSKLTDTIHSALDKWDAFKASPLKTHAACAVLGLIVGLAVAWK